MMQDYQWRIRIQRDMGGLRSGDSVRESCQRMRRAVAVEHNYWTPLSICELQ